MGSGTPSVSGRGPGHRRWLAARSWVLCAFALGACARPELGSAKATISGQDGDKTVAGTEVVNVYAPLTASANAGDTSLSVSDASGFAPGDLVLLVASQGAAIDASNASSYGAVTALGPAGQHEFWSLQAVDGVNHVLTLDAACGLPGLSAPYPLSSRPQVIRVPQYRNLVVPAGATLTGTAWNGASGGFVVVHVEDTASIDGLVTGDSLGFRGGTLSAAASTLADDEAGYASATAVGGEKGEGIAGRASDYDGLSGRYGRGAPANAGGGGNGYLAGGGGGAGADATNAAPYSGQGTMLGSVSGSAAWSLDPGNATAGGPGGGRGGYSLSATDLDATLTGPSNALWGANARGERGGLGGHALATPARLFLGGGGGAGSYDGPSTAPSGGRGGGAVYLIANTVAGAGVIRADGQDGAAGTLLGTGSLLSVATGGGSGGGGGGGMVVVRATGAAALTLSARGGAGGASANSGTFGFGVSAANGPGGGGAGGAVVLGAGLAPTTMPDVRGGLGGTTTAAAVAEFPSNGATAGDAGAIESNVAQASAPRACLPADVQIQLADSADPVETGSGFQYNATVKNNGPNAAYDLSVSLAAPSGVTTGGVTAPGWSCAQVGQVLTCTRALLAASQTDIIAWAMLAPSAEAMLSASATVSSREDPAAGNNVSGDTTLVLLPQADLALTVDVVADTASNEPFTYTSKVTNGGPRSAPSLQVVHSLPAGVTYQAVSGAGWSCAAVGSIVTCSHGTLASGATSSFVLQVTAPPLTSDTALADHATVSLASSGAHDPDPSNDAAVANVVVHPVDLSLAKTDSADPVGTAANITYTLTVDNPAVVAAHGVAVTDTLPAGTSLVSASGSGWTCSLIGNVVTCSRNAAFANPTATPSITVVITAPASSGTVINTAAVTATATDPSPGNNSASQTTTVVPPSPGSADLAVALLASATKAPIGTPLDYTLSVANLGPDPASSAQVQVVFPSDVTVGTPSAPGWSCSVVANVVTCAPTITSLGKLPPGNAPIISIPTTTPAQASLVSVTATVGSTTPDPAPANDHATVEVDVVDPAVVNDPPSLLAPAAVTTEENVPFVFRDADAPQVVDPDAGNAELELRVDASRGAFTLSSTIGLSFLVGDGILDPHLVVRGTQAALTAALAGSIYTPDPGFFGTVVLSLLADDLGNLGTGGPQQATASVAVTVSFVDSPPVARDDDVTVPSDRTSSISVLANDDSGDPDQVLSLTSATLPAHGTVEVLAGVLRYTPAPKYLGDDAFDYTCSDGAHTATGHVLVHVVADPSPPTTTFLGGGGVGCAFAGAQGTHEEATSLLGMVVAALASLSWRRRPRDRRPG